ncbi:uncharacterized protein K02A2.6-like [Toxorhynchites rutilus septentrionalis]|uniref:uncharacterized protein K02A2.6-like n=1 Tax=Toxorhynchites rutilus septentrionalis TaxID=329112 RepID=UPI00247A4C4A|nr:uncharacterized protein K02A2.6-like [Toxorhynchites rutilus septentrionalis]
MEGQQNQHPNGHPQFRQQQLPPQTVPPGLNPGNSPPGHQQQSHQQPIFTQGMTADSIIVQILQHLQQQQVVTNQIVQVEINGVPVRLQLDTASDITIVSEQVWKQLRQPTTVPATQVAKSTSGEQLDLRYEFVYEVSFIGSLQQAGFSSPSVRSTCWASTSSTNSIFGHYRWTISATISVVYLWITLGLCNKAKVKLVLKESCRPIFRPRRPVSYAMLPTVEGELDRLERLNIISPVNYSEWTTPIVVVREANGSIRICGNYFAGINERLQSHQYSLPLPQDIFSKLAGCIVFSTNDLSDAFLQMEVDESSHRMLTINTHRGLYEYNRLPLGVGVAPGAFQQLIDTVLGGLSGTSGYLDDVIIGGKNDEEHQYRHGIRPDPAKITAIKNMPPPQDLTGVRSFLGAINYYGKFAPNMRTIRYPLDELLKSSTSFIKTWECRQTFDEFKRILSSELLLTHYNPEQEIVVSADASSVGVGAIISHKFPDGKVKIIQHASRALNAAEQRYSQPDREGLAIVFANHVSADCPVEGAAALKCANCGGDHQESDKQCPKREVFKRIRKEASSSTQPKPKNRLTQCSKQMTFQH